MPEPAGSRQDRFTNVLRPIHAPAAAELVYQRMQDLILDGTFRAGDKLPAEPDLAQMLQVGRSTVREAKKTLAARGLIEARGKLGTFVTTPQRDPSQLSSLRDLLSNPQLGDLHESRQIVEIGSIRLAAVRASDTDLRGLYRTLTQIEHDIASGEPDAALRLVTFHRHIVRVCRNGVMTSVYDLIAHLLGQAQVPYYDTVLDIEDELASHRHLVDMIATRDPDRAGQAMLEHLGSSEKLRQDSLERIDESD